MPQHVAAAKPIGSRFRRWLRLSPARSQRPGETPPAGVPPPQPAGQSSFPQPVPPQASPVRATVLVTVLGVSGRALDQILELVINQAETQQIAPVFVTDTFDFGPFRRRRLRFEYLPDRDRQQRFAPGLDWDVYVRRRYALLGEKWQARSVISFGCPPPRECVANGRPAPAHSGSMAPKGER